MRTILLPLLAIALYAAPLAADETAEKGATSSATEPATQGVRVFLDPETGEIVATPTEEQLRVVAPPPEKAFRQSWDLEFFFLSGGGEGVFLDGWADHALRVERNPDGELAVVCDQPELTETVSRSLAEAPER